MGVQSSQSVAKVRADAGMSLAISMLDSALAVENIVNGRRAFGNLVDEGNIESIIHNAAFHVGRLMDAGITGSYRYIPLWYTTLDHPLLMIRLLRLLPGSKVPDYEQWIGRFKPTGMYMQKVRQAIIDCPEWNVGFSFYGQIDASWLKLVKEPINVFKEVEDSDGFEELLARADSGDYMDLEERDYIKLLEEDDVMAASLFLVRFFPERLLKTQTWKSAFASTLNLRRAFSIDFLESNTYRILKRGIPALCSVLGYEYPVAVPTLA